jgi:hypothetical protein
MIPWSAVRAILVAVALLLPLPAILRSEKKLTWTKAVILGAWLIAITIILIGDVPSRILYWFDANHSPLAERFHFLGFMEKDLGGNPGYQVVADIVANTAQGVFFIIICAGTYFWGEKHRKDGKFKS